MVLMLFSNITQKLLGVCFLFQLILISVKVVLDKLMIITFIFL